MTTLTVKTDQVLQQDVQHTLMFEPSIPEAHIGVSVEGGIVTLSGHVPDYNAKWAAEYAALHVQGARGVADELEVDLSGTHRRNDTDLAASAVTLLDSNVRIPKGLRVTVEHGFITLTGEVSWRDQRKAAETAVRTLNGVRGINNQISVAARPGVNAIDVHQQITQAFHRHASLDGKNVQVSVHGDVVTLTDTVHTWAEREDADHTAWSVPGIHQVINHLEVHPTHLKEQLRIPFGGEFR